MKKHIFSLVLLTLSGVGTAMCVAQDQDPAAPPQQEAGRPRMDPERQLKMLTKRLKLSSDQQNQIRPILTDAQAQMQKLREDSSTAPEDRREKMRSIREDSQTRIKAVLNDDQKKTFDQMQQQMRERMQQRNEGNSGPDGSH